MVQTLRKPSPSYRNKLPNLASQMRTAFSSKAWNLVGEAHQQVDLPVVERTHLSAIDGQVADRLAALEHRDQEHSAGSGELDERDHAWIALEIGWVDGEVGDMNDGARPQHAAGRRIRTRPVGPAAALLDKGRRRIVQSGEAKSITVPQIQ